MTKQVSRISAHDIDVIVYDFDGVHTNNKVLVLENGLEAVECNRADGYAVAAIKAQGIPQIILSTETNTVVKARADKLGIDAVHGVNDKKSILEKYCVEKGFSLGRVVYIGNDLNDKEIMEKIGYPIAPQDAHEEILRISVMRTKACGGCGVVREFYEKILEI